MKAALVVCDLISMPRDVAARHARLIAESPRHPAGAGDDQRDPHAHRPASCRGSARDPSEGDAAERGARRTSTSLPELIAESRAERRREARAGQGVAPGVGHEERLSFNRRFFMKDGTVGWNPGKLNPKIVRPAGPIDPAVPVVYFESADERQADRDVRQLRDAPRHRRRPAASPPTTPAPLAALLAKVKGPDMLTVFATGAVRRHQPHRRPHRPTSRKAPTRPRASAPSWPARCIKTYAQLRAASPTGRCAAKNEVVPLPLRRGQARRVRSGAARRSSSSARTRDVDGAGAGVQGARRRRAQGQAARGGGAGDRARRRPGVGRAARRDLRRAGAGHEEALAVQAHDHRRAGQRLGRLRPDETRRSPRATTSPSAPAAPPARARCSSTPRCGC